jgi:hypothetical protein
MQGRLRSKQHNDEGAMSGLNTAAPELCLDVSRLLQQFEGLGDICDFGMVQRAVGIDPFGLFRFGGCSAADMASLLRTRFQQFGEPEDLWLEEVGPAREYLVKSRQCSSFSAHTRRYAGRDDPEVVRSAQIESIRFLKRKLIRDLSLDRRLFVHRGRSGITAVQEIAAQLRTYGDNRLLWVNLADATHLPGSVECLSDGLLRGFISHFGTYGGAPHLPVNEWIAVCAKAYRLWREADPPMALLQNLISRARAARRCRSSADPSAATRVLDEPAPTAGAMLEHRLGTTEPTSVYRVHLPVAFGGIFTFSDWILIPEGFRGQRIVAKIPGCSIVSRWRADPKSPGRWQRLWVTATLPVDARSISCDLIAEGAVSDVFHSASWCLERRSQPLGYGFAL